MPTPHLQGAALQPLPPRRFSHGHHQPLAPPLLHPDAPHLQAEQAEAQVAVAHRPPLLQLQPALVGGMLPPGHTAALEKAAGGHLGRQLLGGLAPGSSAAVRTRISSQTTAAAAIARSALVRNDHARWQPEPHPGTTCVAPQHLWSVPHLQRLLQRTRLLLSTSTAQCCTAACC
jgi:hypothetical protein